MFLVIVFSCDQTFYKEVMGWGDQEQSGVWIYVTTARFPLLSTTLHPHDWKLITGEGEGGIGQRALKGGEGGECQDSFFLQ